MDNASYHNLRDPGVPNSSTVKAKMKEWLLDQGCCIPEGATRPTLWSMVKIELKKDPRYTIDRLAKEHGMELLRLPPYCPTLNAIELFWAKVKNDVARSNTTYEKDYVRKLIHRAMDRTTTQHWKNFVKNVIDGRKLYSAYSPNGFSNSNGQCKLSQLERPWGSKLHHSKSQNERMVVGPRLLHPWKCNPPDIVEHGQDRIKEGPALHNWQVGQRTWNGVAPSPTILPNVKRNWAVLGKSQKWRGTKQHYV